MVKKLVKYTDFNGNQGEKEVYFNLSAPELVELDTEYPDGLAKTMEQAIENEDKKTLFDFFKMILVKSYGEKSDDGLRFIKSRELTEAFEQSVLFAEVFMELATDADKASVFINALVPSIGPAQEV